MIRNNFLRKVVAFIVIVLTIGLRAKDTLAQDKVLDSLLQLIKKTKNDTAKARLLFEAGDYISAFDTAQAVSFIKQGFDFAKDNQYSEALGYFFLGRAYIDYNHKTAKTAFKRCLQLMEKYETKEAFAIQSRSWSNLAVIEQRQNNDEECTRILLNKAIPLAIKSGDRIKTAAYYTLIGIPFMNKEHFDKAIFYFTKSNNILLSNGSVHPSAIDNYTHIAHSYLMTNDTLSAKKNLDSAYQLVLLYPNSIYSTSYRTIESMYFVNINDFPKALNSLNIGLSIAQKNNRQIDVRDMLYQKMRLYDSQKNYKDAIKIASTLLSGDYFLSNIDKKNLYKDMSELHADIGEISAAFLWLKKYTKINDSLSTNTNKLAFAELEAKYNYSLKEKELLMISSREKLQRIIMWVSIGVLLLAFVLFIYFYRARKAKADQQMLSLKQQQRVALTKALLQGEEKERARLPRDLHDGLGGMLAGVKINLSHKLLNNQLAGSEKVISLLDNSINELRRIARNMMPEALLRSGLQTALTDLCQDISNEKLKINYSFINVTVETMPKQVQIIIFRIVQELLTNIVKHSEASEAYLQCSQDSNRFYITVEDNGKGINQSRYTNRGIGLDNIQSRVDFLNGKMDFNSVANNGTITNIEITTDEQL